MLPAVQETRIRSLADMARALGRSEALFRLLEIAAEEARGRARARERVGEPAGDRHEHGADHRERRRARADRGAVARERGLRHGRLREPRGAGQDWIPWRAARRRPRLPTARAAAAPAELGKVTARSARRSSSTASCGASSTRPGLAATTRTSAACDLVLPRGADGDPRRRDLRALREESLEQLAYRDPLTGLLNRRALDERAAQAFDVAPRSTRTVTVVSLDINRLKQVNDTLGHLAGDQLIQSVARALTTEFSRLAGSLVARVGGDEFTVLVSGHDPAAVVAAADRLCRRTWHVRSGRRRLGRCRDGGRHARHDADAGPAVRGGRPAPVRREARPALLDGGGELAGLAWVP